MTLTFNDDPCLDSESNFRDDNVFKRSVIRLLCRLVPAATTVLGKIGLIDPAGADIDISNPLPVQGTVNISTLPPVTVVLPADSATSTLQLVVRVTRGLQHFPDRMQRVQQEKLLVINF